MFNHATLMAGTSLMSTNKCFKLEMQLDGNLLLSNVLTQQEIWSTQTSGLYLTKGSFNNCQFWGLYLRKKIVVDFKN